ncbi:preprotein translocase subunit SecE [Patescibacteria group bacterium]|nr:preprotein translocase subunit SecE [Patescibacteria group bacterium]MBU4116047.1 preprotein translocase subunit SecE [Patescibacteria group bacterium]
MKPVEYLKSIKTELKHVSWPTKKQAMAFSVIVVVISVATSLYLGFFDFIFSKILEFFVL